MVLTIIYGLRFTHEMDPAELKPAVAQLDSARLIVMERSSVLREAALAEDRVGQAATVGALLCSPEAGLATVIRAVRAIPDHKCPSREQCEVVAANLDRSKPIKESVRVCPKPRNSGGYRIIHDHGIVHRAAQQLVRRVMDPFFRRRALKHTQLATPTAHIQSNWSDARVAQGNRRFQASSPNEAVLGILRA